MYMSIKLHNPDLRNPNELSSVQRLPVCSSELKISVLILKRNPDLQTSLFMSRVKLLLHVMFLWTTHISPKAQNVLLGL
jgi:hypothetical protein